MSRTIVPVMEEKMNEALLSSHKTALQSLPVADRGRSLRDFARTSRARIGALLLSMVPMAVQAGDPARHPEAGTEGTLVIAGGGVLPPEIHEYFIERAKGKNGKVVVIPAHKDADLPGQTIEDFWKHSKEVRAAHLLHAPNTEAANDPEFTRELDDADGVWLSGGEQERLLVYVGTLTAKKIRRVFDRGGVVGGTSAGAAALSTDMILKGDPAEIGEGFGFLDDFVDQHYSQKGREKRLRELLKVFPKKRGMGVDERTAAVVRGPRVKVFGEGNVRLYPAVGETNAPEPVRILKAGDEEPLYPIYSRTRPTAER